MDRSKVILPKKLISNPQAMARAITNGLEAGAKAMQVDFKVTTQTWEHGVSFVIEAPTPWQRIIGTSDGIYAMLNEGTRAHPITAHGGVLAFRTPFRAKTLPNSISSGAGGRGNNQVFRRTVQHPGTKARNWDKAIAKKLQGQFAVIMQRAIDATV